MRVLVISRSPWRFDNSFGNTYSSIFRNMLDVEIANIYLADGEPEYENNVKAYFQVSESELISNVKRPFHSRKVGKVVYAADSHYEENSFQIDSSILVGKKRRWPIMFIIREFIWKFGGIDYSGMKMFVSLFKPDIIFLPFYYAAYVYRVALFIQKAFDLPITGEASLDIYSLKQFSIDPFYWINRFYIRKWIRKTSRCCASLYLVSEKMRKDYMKYLNLPCKVLYKIPDFSRMQSKYTGTHSPVRFLYTGNIASNRWKTLGLLADALKQNKYGFLDIYTATPLTNEMIEALNIINYSQIHSPVSQEEVKKLQNEADVLVHAESFDLVDKLLVRYSISTKIMDYLCMGRAILAIGPNDIASMEYLAVNDAAMIATNKDEINRIVRILKNDSGVIEDYSKKGLAFAKTSMNAEEMKLSLYNDMKEIINNHAQS